MDVAIRLLPVVTVFEIGNRHWVSMILQDNILVTLERQIGLERIAKLTMWIVNEVFMALTIIIKHTTFRNNVWLVMDTGAQTGANS